MTIDIDETTLKKLDALVQVIASGKIDQESWLIIDQEINKMLFVGELSGKYTTASATELIATINSLITDLAQTKSNLDELRTDLSAICRVLRASLNAGKAFNDKMQHDQYYIESTLNKYSAY